MLNNRGPTRDLTLEKANEIAELLRSNQNHTLTSASVKVGIPPATTRKAMSRFDQGTSSAAETEVCMVIASGLQDQFMDQRTTGLVASTEKNKTLAEWQRWRLECAAPAEHARITKTELTGKDGEPLEFKDLSLQELLKLAAEDE